MLLDRPVHVLVVAGGLRVREATGVDGLPAQERVRSTSIGIGLNTLMGSGLQLKILFGNTTK
jgi:hypothetical protein